MAILTTSGTPLDTFGATGDYALDPAAHFIWGPKTTTWNGTASSLQGPSGPGMVYGRGAPTNGDGAIGQGFLDLTTGNVYGPKAPSGAWGNPVSKLQGAQGLSVLTGQGAPAASNVQGQIGQVYIDTTQYNIYTYGAAGWGSPTALLAPSPTLGATASAFGPSAQFAGQTIGTSVTPMFFPGTQIPHTFTPQSNTALTGLTATNANSGATLFFYLNDLSNGSIVYNYAGGNGLATNTTAAVNLSASPVQLLAGRTYQWAAQRVTAGAGNLQVSPQYLTPSQNGAVVQSYGTSFVHATPVTLLTNGVLLQAAGQTVDRGFYRNASNSYLYSISYTVVGSGTLSFVLSNGTTNLYTSPQITATSAGTVGTFGPYGLSTAFLAANTNVYWFTSGTGGTVTASMTMSVCQ